MKLRDIFLGDSTMARLWWSNGEPDRLLRLADGGVEKFDAAVGMVTESRAGSAAADKIASLVERFLAGLRPDHRKLLITQLAKVFTSYQRAGLAEELTNSDS
ncbi:MAG TPA: hypothetical protein VKV80_09660 [Streptosporangiaceae bacterium]|nr:hypothetical protein [Streptosporangiaceae bacterium]